MALNDQDLTALFKQIQQNTGKDAYEVSVAANTPSLTSSKLGGLPYWPGDLDYPVDASGSPLFLLAQINLEDLGGDSRLPTHGLLQFFIAGDDCYGLDFSYPIDRQEGFRVVFHPNTDTTITEEDVVSFGAKAAEPSDMLPIDAEHAIMLTPSRSWITPLDAGFDTAFAKAYEEVFGQNVEGISWDKVIDGSDEDFWHMLMKDNTCGSQMLGYPFFTQWDPRDESTLELCDTVLLQLDSEMAADSVIMWGDCGIGAFFTNGDAAASGDFSHVLYNWDCY